MRRIHGSVFPLITVILLGLPACSDGPTEGNGFYAWTIPIREGAETVERDYELSFVDGSRTLPEGFRIELEGDALVYRLNGERVRRPMRTLTLGVLSWSRHPFVEFQTVLVPAEATEVKAVFEYTPEYVGLD